jgi:hypothetical protein
MGLIREEGLWLCWDWPLVDESKCKIIVSAEAGPEDLFFPDALDDKSRETNEEVMAQEALSDAVAAPFRPNVSSYSEPEQAQLAAGDSSGRGAGGRQGDAARMFKRRERSHPSEETTPAFKTLSIFTGGSSPLSGEIWVFDWC